MWHKFSLRELLIENKYSFSGRAGSTGGLVSRALFTFCPTIKIMSVNEVDGDDSTDVTIKIGKGYEVTNVKGNEDSGYIPVTEPTSAENANVEVGFEGKRIFIGSLIAGGYQGTTIKEDVYWDPGRLARFEPMRRPRTARQNMSRLGCRVRLRPSARLRCVNPNDHQRRYGNDTGKPQPPSDFIANVTAGFNNFEWEMDANYVRNCQDAIEDIRRIAGERPEQRTLAERTIQMLEDFIDPNGDASRYPRTNGEIRTMWDLGLQGGVDCDPTARRPEVSGAGVNKAESDGQCYWLQFQTQSNQTGMPDIIESHGQWITSEQAWTELGPKDEEGQTLPVPSDINQDVLVLRGSTRDEEWEDLPGSTGSGLADFLSGWNISPEEQQDIWNAIGDDYFVFLDVQGDSEVARIVRSKTAPVPGIGHWSKSALYFQDLYDESGKPVPTGMIAPDTVPDEAVFEIKENGKVVSIPELEVKIIPPLSRVVGRETNWSGQHRDGRNQRIDLFLGWENWSWDGAQGYPFNPKMMSIVKQFEIKK